MLRGTGWIALSTWVLRIAGLATFMVIGRLLSPAEVGLATLTLGVVGFAGAVLDLGFATYLVRARDLDDAAVSTAFWLVLAQAGAAALLVVVLAGPTAALLHEPALATMMRVIAPTLLVGALSAVPAALLLRELEMRALALREVVSGLVGAAVGVGSALAGAGAWSLVAQSATQTVVAAVLIWRLHPWRPRRLFSRRAASSMVRFGLPLLGTTLVQQSRDRIDQFLVGAVAGTAALGYWAISTRILSVVAQATISVLDQVALPVFARRRADHAQLARGFEVATTYATAVLGPAVAAVAALSPVLIPLLFGSQWGPSIVPAQILCAAYGIGSLSYFARAVYLTEGRTTTDLVLAAIALVVHVLAVVLAGAHGLTALSTALVGETVLVLVLHAAVLRRLVGVQGRAYARSALALLASGVTYVVMVAVLLLPGPAVAVGALSALVGMLAYLGLTWLVLRSLVREIVHDVRGALRRDRRGERADGGADDDDEAEEAGRDGGSVR